MTMPNSDNNQQSETNRLLKDMADNAYLSVANEPRPEPPDTDDAASAGDLINFVLDRCLELTDGLYRYATARFEEAPVTSWRAIELASTLSNEVVVWVRRWEGRADTNQPARPIVCRGRVFRWLAPHRPGI